MFPIHHDTDKEIHKSKWHNKMIMKKKLRLGQKKRLDYFKQKPKETQAIWLESKYQRYGAIADSYSGICFFTLFRSFNLMLGDEF